MRPQGLVNSIRGQKNLFIGNWVEVVILTVMGQYTFLNCPVGNCVFVSLIILFF